tara:strand:- start:1724 stop:2737 length:1014 start_codon:yes stop_codon:yes gene_type:complete
MEFKNIKKAKPISVLLFLVGLIGIIAVLGIQINHLVRSFIIFISILMMIYSLVIGKTIDLILFDADKNIVNKWLLYTALFLSCIFVLLLIFDPGTFNELSNEDSIVEWSSALFLFGASITFLVIWKKSNAYFSNITYYRWLLLLFSMAFFVLGMEEVSWFQREIGFDTPKAFEGNLQNEFNLHNFATHYSEIIYYNGSFVFLVLLPFIELIFPTFIKNRYLKYLIPRPFIMVIGALFCSYNFVRWESIITQITFFSSILILISLALFCTKKTEKNLVIFTVFLLIIQQIVFLNNGANYEDPYVLKEFKEFFIPLGYLVFSLDVYSRLNNIYSSYDET